MAGELELGGKEVGLGVLHLVIGDGICRTGGGGMGSVMEVGCQGRLIGGAICAVRVGLGSKELEMERGRKLSGEGLDFGGLCSERHGDGAATVMKFGGEGGAW